jgi:hypothetical protein
MIKRAIQFTVIVLLLCSKGFAQDVKVSVDKSVRDEADSTLRGKLKKKIGLSDSLPKLRTDSIGKYKLPATDEAKQVINDNRPFAESLKNQDIKGVADTLATGDVGTNLKKISAKLGADSISALDKEQLKNGKLTGKSQTQVDKVLKGAQSVEDGKLIVPDSLSENALKEKIDQDKILKQTGLSKDQIEEQQIKLDNARDSVGKLQQKGEELLNIANGDLPPLQRIYSHHALKKLYDSLGISKVDSVLALVKTKENVSKEDLLSAIDKSFPSDLGNKLDADPQKQLGNLQSDPLSALDKDGLKAKDSVSSLMDLSKINLPDDIKNELPPMRGVQVPTKYLDELDSIKKLKEKVDHISTSEQEVSDNVTKIVTERKPAFWDKFYVDGVVSYFKNGNDVNVLQFAPSLAYTFAKGFSIGLGPSIQVGQKDKQWQATISYRAFTRYELFNQKAYVQLEETMDPLSVTEQTGRSRHSILAGGGYILPLSKTVGINLLLMYRVNNEQYSGGELSPWVFRIGLSSIRPPKFK